jgi:2'-5' RNA ligase
MSNTSLRLFFALSCPAHAAQDILAWREQTALGGHWVSPDNLHITLAFLGNQPLERLPALQALADDCIHAPFRLELDHLSLLARRFACLEPMPAPECLLGLQAQLATTLERAGLFHEPRPYRPHLTLSRECHQLPASAPPKVTWQVAEFGLYASEPSAQGVRYRCLQHWALRAA